VLGVTVDIYNILARKIRDVLRSSTEFGIVGIIKGGAFGGLELSV
jgi:hypothetical protein